MSEVLASVDSRTKLAGHNRLELLLFGLGTKQRYGINVFKVREVIRCPSLSPVPEANAAIKGIADIRGMTITIIDLAESVGLPGIAEDKIEESFVVITEYNRTVQGFLVHSVDRIVNLSWEEILAPPSGTSANNFLTAVTRVDGELVEIIDVEQVFAKVVGVVTDVSEDVVAHARQTDRSQAMILVADDSYVARNQIQRTLENIGIKAVLTKDGAECLRTLKTWKQTDPKQIERLSMVISDVEMPNMDGYTLTTEIRKDEALRHLYVMLHTSLSGVFNQAMVERVGADMFIAKFHPDDLAKVVLDHLNERHVERA